MKSIYFLSTKLRYYLVELPLIVLLAFAIINNGVSKEPLKLYPLIITTSLGIIFIFIYFLRLVKISTDEVRCVGIFSSRDSVVIKKDKRLVITVMKHNKLLVEVFGIGEVPTLDWVDPEDYKDTELNLLRTKTVGSARAAKRILSYFHIDKEDFREIFENENFTKEYEFITLTSRKTEKGREIGLKFNETL